MVKTTPPVPPLIATVPAPGRLHYTCAFVTVALAIIAALAAAWYGDAPLPYALGFVPASGSITIFADFFTAALLLGQSRANRSQPLAWLAAAYLFCSVVSLSHLLSFPGIFTQTPLLGRPGSSLWLWCIWHFGFPVLVAKYALARDDGAAPSRDNLRLLAIVTAAALAGILLATLGLPALPDIMAGTHYGRLNTLGIGPALVACNGVVLALVVVKRRLRDTLALWIAVAMVCSTLDSWLGIWAENRFTVAWYLSRALSLMSNITVFIALLFQSMRLFAHASVLNRHLVYLSLTDPLTQLPNRRAFERSFDAEWRRAEREDLPISMLMIDIDLFKGFNDRLGHPAGDRCLGLVAKTVNALARRPLDIAARLGGEEFALLLPNTDSTGASQMGEKLRNAIEALGIGHPASPWGCVTASIGVATLYPHGQNTTPGALIERADQALYAAKRAGRNRVLPAPAIHGPDATIPRRNAPAAGASLA